jgi:diguanylate cyclase (GGDEF)-like protein
VVDDRLVDSRLSSALRTWLPEGRLLAGDVWRRRHAGIVRLALVQAVGVSLLALGRGTQPGTAAVIAVAIALPLLAAIAPGAGRPVRAAAATSSLMAASIALVHVMSGITEAHFHFFVMVGVVSLYQAWTPFGVALLAVLLHHGLIGTLHPHLVFGTVQAQHDPWLWAGVHGAYVLAASLAHLASWRLNEQQGLRDALTGLPNRVLLGEHTHRLLQRRGQQVSVLFCDLDDFKDVNDTRGHAAGDQLLVTVAERLRACVRPGDEVARLGGDEFAVVVAGTPRTARTVGERILTAMAAPVRVEGHSQSVRVSIGIADSATAGDRSHDTLLRNADLAMYLAKASGKNQLVVYADGMAQSARSRADLVGDLSQALAAGQLEVHYQATVTLADARTTGYEALLRWRHPVRGMIPPVDFIPLAEDNGLIADIGRWVLGEATRQAVAWSAEAGRPIEVAINLSPVQLTSDDVVRDVRDALAASGLPAGQLILEVTEGVLVREVAQVAGRLQELRDLGIRIAIDDFGTGYSSLAYLRQLPADVLKIDRSFVADLDGGGAATTLVSSILELARSLGLEVVAEGVETTAQRTVLEGLHCTYAQGYLFARPRPAAQQHPAGPVAGPPVAVRLPAGPAAPEPVAVGPVASV